MKKTLAFAAAVLVGAGSLAFAQKAGTKAMDPYLKLRQIIERFNVVYAETEQLLRLGVKGVSPAARATDAVEKEMVQRDKEALDAFETEDSTTAMTAKLTKQCLETNTVNKLAADYQKNWVRADLDLVDPLEMLGQLSLYNAAKALAADNIGLCGGRPLFDEPFKAGLKPQTSVADYCREIYGDMLRTKAILTKSVPVCMKSLGSVPEIEAGNRAKFCETLVAFADRPVAAAAKLAVYMPAARAPQKQAEMVESVKRTAGLLDEAACAKFKSAVMTQEKCLGALKLKKALATGRIADCGSSGLCAAVMGNPRAAEIYDKRAVKLFCSRYSFDTKSVVPPSAMPARLERRTLLTDKLKRDREMLAAKQAALKDLNRDDSPEKQLQEAYMAKIKELRWLIDEGMRFLQGYEPKSDPKYEEWYARVLDLNPRFEELTHRGASKVRVKPTAVPHGPDKSSPAHKTR